MRAKYIPFLTALLLIQTAAGQNDQKALALLDKFSSNALEAPSVSMDFRMVTDDIVENKTDSIRGSVIISKDKYRLILPDNIVWFNGETSWNYLTAEEEVTITKADRKDHSFQNRPSEIFTMYKKGYKSRLIGEDPKGYTLDLYPEDLKSDLIRVRLVLSKPKLDLMSFGYKRRDGMIVTLDITGYSLKIKPETDTFTFPSAKYKGAEVIDMR